jgi:hypothetical protein
MLDTFRNCQSPPRRFSQIASQIASQIVTNPAIENVLSQIRAGAADTSSKAAAAAARRAARGGIPLSSKSGSPSGVTPPADSTAESDTGDGTRNGAGDAVTEAHSHGPNADGARCAAAVVAGDCPTPAQASALAAASRHAAASAAEHAEDKRLVATALATSAACAARAEADARQESADIQRPLQISVAWRRHVRSHVPGHGEEAYEHLPFMAATIGGHYCALVSPAHIPREGRAGK